MLQTAALILAAGKGTRMHSDKPKVLQTVLGEPMLRYVLEAVRPVFDGRVLVVVGHQAGMVEAAFPDASFVHQEQQLGTGHALMQAMPALEKALQEKTTEIEERLRGKAQFAVRALNNGTQRAHILDGRTNGGLLAEIFDKVGTGSMIHANDYDCIRPAKKKDAQFIYSITKNAVKNKSLVKRSRQLIESHSEDYFVYEIDESIIGCACLRRFADAPDTAELCSVYVQPFYQDRGVGKKLVAYAEHQAREEGIKNLITCTTQTYGFFKSVCGFDDAEPKDLPPSRKTELAENGRNSKALIKKL